jgi:hypothetical protein
MFDYYGETATHFILSEEVGKAGKAESKAFGVPKEAVTRHLKKIYFKILLRNYPHRSF